MKMADWANFSPSKKKVIIKKGCEHLRKTGLKFIVTYKERSENKKLIKLKKTLI